ncbi:MAG: preprotein translocase subunit SecG, partial [Candidatus Binatia bacterium]
SIYINMLWLNILFLLVSIALTGAILLQARSAGLGSAFGGGSEGFHVRRGSEKVIFRSTVILSGLFLALALTHLFIR